MPATTIKKILVPADFSPCSRAALEYAAGFAQRFDASVDVIHVWEPPRYLSPETTVNVAGQRSDLPLAQFARSEAGREMDAFLASLENKGIAQVKGRLGSGDPCNTILEAAREGYDLIVMGTHGRTGLQHMLLGSVAEKVVRRATCPVLTIRAPDGAAAAAVERESSWLADPER